MSEEDKLKLESLDTAWEDFQKGLDEANVIIQKCYTQPKQEVDSSILDFKKEASKSDGNWFENFCPFRILNFEEIERTEEHGMSKKNWTKVKYIVDKINPEFRKRARQMRMNIDDWR